MEVGFCFILLFIFFFFIGDSDGFDKFWSGYTNDGIYRNYGNNEDHRTYGGYRDSIIRPCSLQDLKCIRRVFAYNSKCTPVYGPAPDPYILRRLDLPIPQANLTFSLLNAQVKGLNKWKIKDFFINKATDRLVLEVVFDKIVVTSPGAKTTVHRKGKEPIEVTDKSSIEYYGISFTLTIPNILDLKLSEGHVFTYVADADPPYTLGPAVEGNKDPDFVKGVSIWLENLGVTMQEVWVSQGPVFMSVFLQSTICDFRHH